MHSKRTTIDTRAGSALRVMLVDSNPGRSALLQQALSDAGHTVVARIAPGSDLVEQVASVQPDMIIIDLDAPDCDTLEALQGIQDRSPKPVVLFAEQSDPGTMEQAIRAGVGAYVVAGLSKDRVQPVMELAVARFREFQALRKALADAKSELADRKVIERAKGILMKKRGLSEEDAYQALRRMAMDRNMKIADVASNLIAMVDLL